MATVTRPLSDLEQARERLDEATANAERLDVQQRGTRDVSETVFLKAQAAVELARRAVTGAEEAEARGAQSDRLKAIGRIRGEIEASADPAAAVAAFEQIASGVAALITVAGPERGRRISRWLNELRGLGVPETRTNEAPSADDAHVGWMSAGMLGSPRIIVSGRAVAPVPLQQVIDGAVAVGCRRAGHPMALIGVSNVAPNLLADPAAWLGRNY
jgi:hypothetical protein